MNNENREKIRSNIKMIIDEHELTQVEMGILTKTSSSTISRILRREPNIKPQMYEKLEEALEDLKGKTKDQFEDEIEDHMENQTIYHTSKSKKSENINDLFREACGIKYRIDKKTGHIFIKNDNNEIVAISIE